MEKLPGNKSIISEKYNCSFRGFFRGQKVQEIAKGVLSIPVLFTLHSISRTTVYKWIYLYSGIVKGVKTVVQTESEQQKTLYLQQRLGELERIIGQKQMEIDYFQQGF